jgi:hypothetical protein
MSRIKLKQILSNLHYDETNDQLILSGSKTFGGLQNWEDANVNWEDANVNWDSEGAKTVPDFVIYGSTYVTSSAYQTGSITIQDIDTFGDSGSFFTMDLGEY